MGATREEKEEALVTLMNYNPKVIHNIKIIIRELSGERMDDTDAFLEDILNALNWEIEVLNGTMDFLNEEKVRVDKEMVNSCIVALGKAVEDKEDIIIAEAFKQLLSELDLIQKAVEQVIK